MPRPLTITEVARRLGHDRVTIRRRVKHLRIEFEGAMTDEQFQRLREDFEAHPRLPRGERRESLRASKVDI
jgi:hypothetical protein